jgi:hypothetical protein
MLGLPPTASLFPTARAMLGTVGLQAVLAYIQARDSLRSRIS